jgi:hypothetical protein
MSMFLECKDTITAGITLPHVHHFLKVTSRKAVDMKGDRLAELIQEYAVW